MKKGFFPLDIEGETHIVYLYVTVIFPFLSIIANSFYGDCQSRDNLQ